MQVDKTERHVGLKVETLSIHHPAQALKYLAVQFCKHKTAIICGNWEIRTLIKIKYLYKDTISGRKKKKSVCKVIDKTKMWFESAPEKYRIC